MQALASFVTTQQPRPSDGEREKAASALGALTNEESCCPEGSNWDLVEPVLEACKEEEELGAALEEFAVGLGRHRHSSTLSDGYLMDGLIAAVHQGHHGAIKLLTNWARQQQQQGAQQDGRDQQQQQQEGALQDGWDQQQQQGAQQNGGDQQQQQEGALQDRWDQQQQQGAQQDGRDQQQQQQGAQQDGRDQQQQQGAQQDGRDQQQQHWFQSPWLVRAVSKVLRRKPHNVAEYAKLRTSLINMLSAALPHQPTRAALLADTEFSSKALPHFLLEVVKNDGDCSLVTGLLGYPDASSEVLQCKRLLVAVSVLPKHSSVEKREGKEEECLSVLAAVVGCGAGRRAVLRGVRYMLPALARSVAAGYSLESKWMPIVEAIAADHKGRKLLLGDDKIRAAVVAGVLNESRSSTAVWELLLSDASLGSAVVAGALDGSWSFTAAWEFLLVKHRTGQLSCQDGQPLVLGEPEFRAAGVAGVVNESRSFTAIWELLLVEPRAAAQLLCQDGKPLVLQLLHLLVLGAEITGKKAYLHGLRTVVGREELWEAAQWKPQLVGILYCGFKRFFSVEECSELLGVLAARRKVLCSREIVLDVEDGLWNAVSEGTDVLVKLLEHETPAALEAVGLMGALREGLLRADASNSYVFIDPVKALLSTDAGRGYLKEHGQLLQAISRVVSKGWDDWGTGLLELLEGSSRTAVKSFLEGSQSLLVAIVEGALEAGEDDWWSVIEYLVCYSGMRQVLGKRDLLEALLLRLSAPQKKAVNPLEDIEGRGLLTIFTSFDKDAGSTGLQEYIRHPEGHSPELLKGAARAYQMVRGRDALPDLVGLLARQYRDIQEAVVGLARAVRVGPGPEGESGAELEGEGDAVRLGAKLEGGTGAVRVGAGPEGRSGAKGEDDEDLAAKRQRLK